MSVCNIIILRAEEELKVFRVMGSTRIVAIGH